MLVFSILTGLFLQSVQAQAQMPIPDHSDVNSNAGGYVNYGSEISQLPSGEAVWKPPYTNVAPAPVLASEFIQSGQLPTWNPNYISNTQGYFVPVLVDMNEELPSEFAQKLVDPSQIEQLQNAAAPQQAWNQVYVK